MASDLIVGPTFEEMLHPNTIEAKTRQKALEMMVKDPLDPINLFNITWGSSRSPNQKVLPSFHENWSHN